jgi:hypothetical protein
MPFVSERQRRWMWANIPEVARRWTQKYGAKPVKPVKPAKPVRPAEERIAIALLRARARNVP